MGTQLKAIKNKTLTSVDNKLNQNSDLYVKLLTQANVWN